jgi:hypothetical protein
MTNLRAVRLLYGPEFNQNSWCSAESRPA